MAEVDEAPPSSPDSPLAIERLVASVEGLRQDLAAAMRRIEANYELLVREHDSLRRGHIDHEERIVALESAVRGPRKTAASRRKHGSRA